MSKQAVTTAILNIVRFITVGPRGFSTAVENSINTMEFLGILEDKAMEGAIKADHFRNNIDAFIASTRSKYLKADYSAAVNLDHCIPYSGILNGDGYAPTHTRQTVFEFFMGRPAEFELDHACCVPGDCEGGIFCPHRACVNASHFHEMKKEVNVGTSNNSRFDSLGVVKEVKERDYCNNEHEMTAENTRDDGKCRACNNLRQEFFRLSIPLKRLERKLALDPSVLVETHKFTFIAKPKVEVPWEEFELFPV